MIIAQLTDLHIQAIERQNAKARQRVANLTAAINQLNLMTPRPDICLITGDLANDGHVGEYAIVRECLDELTIPFLVIPGNHDNFLNLKNAFADHKYFASSQQFPDYVNDDFDLRLIGLDSSVDDDIGGQVTPTQCKWLEDTLSEHPERAALIFMHHPPMNTGISGLDAHSFTGIEEFEAVVRKHSQVEAVICGHVHRSMVTKFANTVLLTSPSTAFQFDGSLGQGLKLSGSQEPPGYLIHIFSPTDGLVTHTRFVDDFGPKTPLV